MEIHASCKFDYDAILRKAYETSRYFFLMNSLNQAYIEDKSTIANEALSNALRQKLQILLGKKILYLQIVGGIL